MLGAHDLNLNIIWRFDFLEYGTQCYAQPGNIVADVGGRLEYGIVDHHLKEGCPYDSTVSVIAHNPHLVLNHLLGLLNETYYRGLDIVNRNIVFYFVAHRNPDWDCMASFFLCNFLVQHGKLPPAHITNALRYATDIIDQGRAKLDGEISRPYILYHAMSSGCSWDELLWKGYKLIEDIIAANKKITNSTFLEPIACADIYKKEIDELESDKIKFEIDISESRIIDLYVPQAGTGQILIKALALKQMPSSIMTKYWVRETTDFRVLIVPYEKDGVITRFVISVDPHSGYSLPCLGYELERAETEKRDKLGIDRGGKPRFEEEYCNNSDPWYDGRNHGFTIVDSPSQGTVLTYDDVVGVLLSLYGEVSTSKQSTKAKYDAFISYRRSGGTDIAWALKTMLEKHGRSVFLDYASLTSGEFDTQILDSVRNAKSLILILSPGALDRCRNDNDWIRNEIRTALESGVKILPLLKDGFLYDDLNNLPEDICQLQRCQGVTMNYEYFYAVVEKLNKYINE